MLKLRHHPNELAREDRMRTARDPLERAWQHNASDRDAAAATEAFRDAGLPCPWRLSWAMEMSSIHARVLISPLQSLNANTEGKITDFRLLLELRRLEPIPGERCVQRGRG
jgi:hypothetical protein